MNRFLGKDADGIPRAEVVCPGCKTVQVKKGWNLMEKQFVCENCGVVFVPLKRLWQEEGRRGLYMKYDVFKTGTNEVVRDCFVLRPDKDPAALAALRTYAETTPNQKLGTDLLAWIRGIEEGGAGSE